MKDFNRVTQECYEYFDLKGDIGNKYIDFVVNRDYGVYQLAKRIREDIEIIVGEAIQTVNDNLIANLLYAITYDIDYVDIATKIFYEAQYYI